MAEKNAARRATKTSTDRTGATTKFSAEERAAMKERARELKAARNKEEGERALLEKIAEMPEPDRAMAERLHAIITKTRSSASSRARTSSSRGTPRSASRKRRTSTRAPCGRPPSR
jgi:hypothetical protein